MKRWAYRHFTYRDCEPSRTLEMVMNQAGEEGWEIFQVDKPREYMGWYHVYCRRPAGEAGPR